jgi:hypothetical protein
MPAIFISYRRQDSQSAAGRLADDLKERLPETRIFRDIETIAPGEDFVEAIERALAECGVLLAIIGPRWLSVTGQDGKRRLDDPKDYTRVEVASALKRKEVRVIPVLVEGAVMPQAAELPDDLITLARRNAIDLTDKRWQYDVGLIEAAVRDALGLDPAKRRGGNPWIWLAGVLAALVLGVGLNIGTTRPPPPPPDRGDLGQAARDIVSVPNVRDLALERAVEALVVAGLRPGERHDVARDSRHAIAGHVLRQAPEPDTTLARGTRVELWVWSDKVVLPNVIGYEADKARQSLAERGLRSQTGYSELDNVKPGVVVGQSPEGDTEQAEGSAVSLTLAKARAPDSRAPVVTLNPKILEMLKNRNVLLQPATTVPIRVPSPATRLDVHRPIDQP